MRKLLRGLLHALPFKRQLYHALRPLGLPEPIYRHLHFKGRFTTHLPDGKRLRLQHFGFLIENEIFWAGLKGSWESAELQFWYQAAASASHVLDVGANTGIYTLLAKTANPQATVAAFEPVQRVHQRLQQAIATSGLQVLALPLAASDRNGTAVIFDNLANEHTTSVTVQHEPDSADPMFRNNQPDTVQIQTQRLDDWLAAAGWPLVDLIKIDVESHEPAVLAGLGSWLAQHRPTLMVEVWNTEIGQAIEAHVQGLDYQYYILGEGVTTEQRPHITNDRGRYVDYVLAPREKQAWAEACLGLS